MGSCCVTLDMYLNLSEFQVCPVAMRTTTTTFNLRQFLEFR